MASATLDNKDTLTGTLTSEQAAIVKNLLIGDKLTVIDHADALTLAAASGELASAFEAAKTVNTSGISLSADEPRTDAPKNWQSLVSGTIIGDIDTDHKDSTSPSESLDIIAGKLKKGGVEESKNEEHPNTKKILDEDQQTRNVLLETLKEEIRDARSSTSLVLDAVTEVLEQNVSTEILRRTAQQLGAEEGRGLIPGSAGMPVDVQSTDAQNLPKNKKSGDLDLGYTPD